MRTIVKKLVTVAVMCAAVGVGGYYVYPLLDTPRQAQAETEVAQAATAKETPGDVTPEGTGGRVQSSTERNQDDPWQVVCSDPSAETPRRCILQQALFARQTGQKVVSATVAKGNEESGPLIEFGLPHGLLLLKGVNISVDGGNTKTVPIRTADENGSYALSPIDDELLTKLRDGETLRVSVTSAAEQAITFELSLKGFSKAYGQL
ncbi:invasion associated locus B family protein [Fulvimarina sp. MAC3]|uniref:invasion associated locus B family protein n=1 Tax=Fulvimarina sp. MAC3 TaxID=3148887 RepID=UPI0031FDBA3C